MFLRILKGGGKSDKKRENSGKSIPLYPNFFKSRYSILFFKFIHEKNENRSQEKVIHYDLLIVCFHKV